MAEGHQEIPINNPEQPLDRKLKKDSVDKAPFDNPEDNRRIGPFFFAPPLLYVGYLGYINYLAYRFAENQMTTYSFVFPDKNLLIAAGSIFAARGLKDIATQQIQIRQARKTERTHSIAEEELGYRADRCVYQGQTPIEIGADTFKKGDNFYFIQLPSMPHDLESSPEALDAWLDAYNYSINDIKERLKDKNYQFVAIDTEQPLDSKSKGSRKELFTGKQGRKIKEEQKPSLLFTREEFENLIESPHEIFEKLTRALGDKMFSHFVLLAKQAKTPDEKSNAKNLVKRRLNQILHLQLEMQFNSTPEVRISKDSSSYLQRQKVNQRSQILETESGLLFEIISDIEGETHFTPLDTLLQTKDKPIDDIIASDRPIRKAQIAYLLHNILRETELEDLIKEPIKNKDEIISNLNKHGIQVQLHEGVSKLVEKKVLPPGVLKKIRLVLAPFILYSAIQQGILFEKYLPPSADLGLSEYINQDYGEKPNTELRFPNSLPQSSIDWTVVGTMPTHGYYFTATSYDFKDKHWNENKKFKRRLDLPRQIDIHPNGISNMGTPYLLVEKPFGNLNLTSDDNFIKVPIKERTELTAANVITMPDNNNPEAVEIKFEIYELTDGTVEIKIPKDLKNPKGVWVIIKLSPTAKNVVHASQHLDRIDTQSLSTDATNILKKSLEKSPNDRSLAIANDVSQNHEYSLDPPGKDKLESAKTPEEVVNAIIAIDGCFCETCNTASVLLSSTLEKEMVNMAYGYIALDNNSSGTAGSSALELNLSKESIEDLKEFPYYGSLRSEAGHAFGINDKGEILDATASKIASDQLTQDYIKLLQSTHRPENVRPIPAINQDASEGLVTPEVKLLAALLAAGAGVVGTLQAARFLKRPEVDEKIGSLSDNVVTSIYSMDDLQKAYNFFGWLSWGKESAPPSNQNVEFSDKKEALAKIRSNINYEKLAQYSERPKAFERIALKRKGVTAITDRYKLRSLASYLLAG